MNKRIYKKRQKTLQKKQEKLQAAWDLVSEHLSKQERNISFFCTLVDAEHPMYYYLHSIHGFGLTSTKKYKPKYNSEGVNEQ